MLLSLVLEFESHRGEISNAFAKKRGLTAGSLYSVGRRNSTRVDEGRKG